MIADELRLGLCGPNQAWREEDYHRLELAQASVVGMMWTGHLDEGGSHHRRGEYLEIARRCPGIQFHLRVGPSRVCSVREWFTYAEEALAEVPEELLQQVVVRVLNEVNLAGEGGWTPEGYAAFLTAAGILWRSKHTQPLCCAPISLDGDWQGWDARYVAALAGAIPTERRAVNCYAHLVDAALAHDWGECPIDCTELGTLTLEPGTLRAAWTVSAATRMADAGWTSAQVYIVGGEPGPPPTWDGRYRVNDDEAAAMGRRCGGRIRSSKPAPPPPKEDPVPEIPFDVDEMREIVRTAAEVHGEDPDLVEALTNQESGFNPRAGSRVGAKGLMQLMDGVADALGVTDSFDPVQNADGGVRFLKENLDKYGGDVVRALVGYNGGHGAVQAWEAGSPIQESIDYVRGILGLDLEAIRPDPCVVQFGQDLRSVLRADELGWIKSACGPIALAGLLERLGRPVPVEEILRWAFAFRHPDGRTCWDPENGMGGLDVYEAFETMAAAFKVTLHRLERAGVRDSMRGDRHGGVVISSTRHYLYAIRASTNDDELYVGNTGNALLDGAPWLSLDWIDANCGGLHALWWGELVADAPPIEPPAPAPVDAETDAENAVWDALSRFAAHDPERAIEAQRKFADVLKPAIARGRNG